MTEHEWFWRRLENAADEFARLPAWMRRRTMEDLPTDFPSRRENGPEYQVEVVTLPICSACLDGVGGHCYVPGCTFWMSRAPEQPIRWHTERV